LSQTLPDTDRPVLSTGIEWVVDAYGCDAWKLTQKQILTAVCEEVISELQLSVVGTPQWHQFPGPAGVTGLYLLSESHLACHTYPEHRLLTLNLYCCRKRSDWDWEHQLMTRVECERVIVRKFARGTALQDLSDTEGLS
jgi:S-adenosylmethionine decarboxylase